MLCYLLMLHFLLMLYYLFMLYYLLMLYYLPILYYLLMLWNKACCGIFLRAAFGRSPLITSRLKVYIALRFVSTDMLNYVDMLYYLGMLC